MAAVIAFHLKQEMMEVFALHIWEEPRRDILAQQSPEIFESFNKKIRPPTSVYFSDA